MAAKKSKSAKKASHKPGVQESVKNVVDEVEKTGEALRQQVREQFEALGHRMSAAASSVAHTAASVTETHMGSEITDILSKAMEHVREAGETTAESIAEGFEQLQQRARAAAEAAKRRPARKKAAKKKAAKKKAAKKKAAKKKTAKKKTARKKTAKKKAARKKTTRKKGRR